MMGLGTGTLESLRRLERNKCCICPKIPLLKMTPRDISWGRPGLTGSPSMKPLIFRDDPTLDQLIGWGYCLADLMVSSPWIHVTGWRTQRIFLAWWGWGPAELTRPYPKQSQAREAELELRGSRIFLCTVSEENGEEEMEIWASGHMVGERRALLVNPESERGHSLYSDGQMQAVAETSWAGLKAQPLYSPALDVGFLRGRSWARDCGRKISNEQSRFSAFQQLTQFLSCKETLTMP